MSLAIPDDALDPVARKVAEVAGLISSGDDAQVRDAFLADPLKELAAAIKDRQPQLIDLLGQLLGSSDAGTLGLPAAGEDRWLPIKGPDGVPTGLYLVLRSDAGTLHVALGWRWLVSAGDLDVSLWAQLPLLSTRGSADSTAVNIASAEAPLRVAAEVRLRGGFGAAGLAFNGVRASLTITGLTEPPQVALVLLGLQLPGETGARDRSLAELASLPGSAWIETGVALFTAQLQAMAGPQAAALVSHLLPLVGLTAPAPLPRLAWEQLPSRGPLVFEDWFLALTTNGDAMRAWLTHWQGLLEAGVGGPVPVVVSGQGTRSAPWQAGVTVGPVQILVQAAVAARAAGGRDLYLGLRVGSTPIALGATPLRLDIAAAAELVAIPIGVDSPVRALPSLALALKLYSTTGPLVDHTFTAPDPLAALAHLQVGSLEAGLGLDGDGALQPLLRLRDVECARGQWPELDLSSANAVLDGLGAVASNLIQQQIEQGLGLLDGGAHAGRRIAALLGLVKPTGVAGAWPVPLVSDVGRIAQFLGDPLAAIGRYHAAALTTVVDGQPAWRQLLQELAELLQGGGLPAVSLQGQGTAASPWRVQLALADAGALTLRAVRSMDGAAPRLLLSAALEPRPLSIDAMDLSISVVADLLQLNLADPAAALRGSGQWLPGLRAELRLDGPQGIETPWLGGLRLGADALTARVGWQPDGVAWQVALAGARAQWRGRQGPPLSLPPLMLGSDMASWVLTAPDLGGVLGSQARDAVAELAQFVIGQGLLEHGGPAGFGLSALLGLLPGDPGISLPSWPGGTTHLSLPDDFPRLQPADWGAFFQDPRPALRAHLQALVSEPRHLLPLLRWLGLALQGLAPRRSFAGQLLSYPEARGGQGDFVLPAAGSDTPFEDTAPDNTAAGDDAPLVFPSLAELPFTLAGEGLFERPYTVGLRGADRRGVQGLIWLDPAGPPSGDALDVALRVLAPALRDTGALAGLPLADLAGVLDVLASLDSGLSNALAGLVPAALGTGLQALEDFLRISDGVLFTSSQTPTAAGWTQAVLEADHVHALGVAAVRTAIQQQVVAWDAAGTLPVLLLSGPGFSNGDWAAVAAALGGGTQTLSFRQAGVAPHAVSTAALTAGARVLCAELAALDASPGVSPTDRLVPVEATPGSSSQAEQVARLVQRLAELRPGQPVLIVAHSAAGLAARAAVQRAGLAPRVRGLLTIGTPHNGSPLTWQGHAPLTEAVGVLQRLAGQPVGMALPSPLQEAIGSLWSLIAERAADGSAAVWPAHAYAPVGEAGLPAGVAGHAIGLRLPAIPLASGLAQSLAARAQTLRTALAGRAPVTHLGLGLALAPVVPVGAAVRCDTTVRLDLLQMALSGAASTRSLPRLVLQTRLTREGGWLVGDAASRIRVRWAELGVALSADGVVPHVRLHDVAVEGQETVLATLREAGSGAPGGLWLADELLVPALDELLARLTSGPTAVAEVTAVARLLALLDLTQRRLPSAADDSGGYALHPDGWASLLADPASHVQQVLAAVLADAARRASLLERLRAVLGLGANDLSRLLLASADDPPAWQALRKLLRALGLLDSEARGSAPILAAWLALLRSPAAYLQAHVAPLLADAGRRLALLAELRDLLGVRDVGGTAEVDLPLGAGVSLHVEALGRVALRLAGVPLGAALQVGGAITFDLSQATGEADLLLRPVDLPAGLRWQWRIGAGWSLALDFSDGERASPFETLPLWPIPADLPDRLGRLLPRVTVSTLATVLLDQVLLPRLPELGPMLAYLGLATPADAATQTRARVQHLARVVADPLGWLQSADTLFKPRAAGAGLELDPARLAGLVREAAGLVGLRDAEGSVALPFGLRLRIDTAPTARLRLDLPTPVTLAQGLSLGGEFTLGWSAAGTLGAGGQLALGADLPSGWGRLAVQAGVADGQIRLALGPEDGLIPLLPFSGFDAGAIGAAASRLLPTLIDASLQALQADAALVAFVTQLRNTATVLEVDTLARLDALIDDPLAWLRRRFSAANAAATAQALAALVPAGQGIAVVGSELRFAPVGAPVRLSLGRPGSTGLGIGITLTGLDLGPVTLQGEITLSLADTGHPLPVLGFELDAQVDDGVIDPAGVSIRPQAVLSIDTDGHIGFAIYPIGQEDGSPDFRLTVLPAFGFGVDEGTLAEGLLEFARRVLVPVVVETLLDTDEVTDWLNTDLGRGLKAGPILADAGLIAADGGTGWNLAPLSQLLNPRARVEGLIGAALHALGEAFDDDALIAFDDAGGGLFIALDAEGPGDTAPYRYGVRVALPELRVSEDPEVIIRLGGRTDWIDAAGGPADAKPGVTLMVLRDDESPPPADPFGLPTRFSFAPRIDLAGVGIAVSGRGDEPLFDISGVQLGGLEALTYLRLDFTGGDAQVDFGLYGDIQNLALPLGASDSNPVAQGLMSSGGGDQAPVNPRFSVRAAYVEKFWLELGGTPDRNEVWFPIQKSFGPVSIQQVGIRWIGGDNLEGAILVDGGVSLAGLSVGVDDLSLTVPFAHIGQLSAWKLGLRGIAVAYEGGGVKIGGGLLQADGDEVRYDGFLLVEVGDKSFVALGSYGVVNGEPSLFVFVVLGIPIGGPPYFFITGLAGGFGYNRGLVVPPIEDMPAFPLVAAMSDTSAVTASPMAFLQRMGDAVPMERGSYWFAAGLKFTSFTLVNSQALLYVLLNRGLEIGLLGMSHMELPPGAPLVSVELALKARFSTIEGVVSVEARLTDNSWVLSRDCRLTGGFAFYLWFDGPHAGDFVISVGGYHPRWTPPDHYPVVPRLGFNWRVSNCITIKGESYFALTPREVMAGGLLEAVYDSGDIRAWFKAWANMYIRWRPFWFEVEIGISIGVSVDTWLGRVKVEVGASLIVWGPDIGGEVTVDVWIISITIPFGAARTSTIDKLTWDQFRTSLLPPEDEKLFAGSVESGLVGGSPATGPWSLLPEFVLRTETLLAANRIEWGGGAVGATVPATGTVHIDVRPMQTAELTSIHQVRVTRVSDGADLTGRFHVREELAGNVPRALWDTDPGDSSRTVMRALTGTRLVASIDFAELDSTGAIPWATLFDDQGRVHPLPFARELTTRQVVGAFAQQALALDAKAAGSATAWFASQLITSDAAWGERRASTLQALAAEGVRIAPSGRSGDVQPRGTYRRGRRNAPPLVRMLHEGLAGEATLAVDSDVVPPPAPAEVVLRPIVPALQAIVRLRVEPTSANGGIGANLRTTVKSREAVRLDVTAMQALRTPPLLGAGVQRVAAASARRATGMASSVPPVQRGLQSPMALRRVLAQVEQAALGGQAPVLGTHALNVDHRVASGFGRGAPVEPGACLRFSLPTRDVTGSPPTMVLMGTAAARVTALDRAGRPLLDVESVGNTKLALPAGVATLAVTGLGTAAAAEVQPLLGALTLHEATHPVPVVGWQAHSELVALSETTLQARGALLALASARPAALQAGTVVAHAVTDGQAGLETYLPPTVRTVIVVLDDAADDAPQAAAELAATLGLSARGAQLDDVPTVLAGGSRVVLVYDVIAVDVDAPWIVVPVAVSAAWTVRGVMGVAAASSVWIPLLTETDPDTLVENGPLNALGSLALRLV